MNKKERKKKEKPKSFRIRAMKYMLTYSDLPQYDYIHRLLTNIVGYQLSGAEFQRKVKFLASRETHSNGEYHVHIYFEFPHRKDVYSTEPLEINFSYVYDLLEHKPDDKLFNIPFVVEDLNKFSEILTEYQEKKSDHKPEQGKKGVFKGTYEEGEKDTFKQGKEGVFKGNYSGVRNKHNTLAYLMKDINSLEDDEVFSNMKDVLPVFNGEYYKDIEDHLLKITLDKGFSAAAETLFRVYPKEAVRRGSALLKNLKLFDAYNVDKELWLSTSIYPLWSFANIPIDVKHWLAGGYKSKTLILYGPPGTGKTELAKAILFYYLKLYCDYNERENDMENLRFLIATDYQDLRRYESQVTTSILYDDIGLCDLTRTQKISILDTSNTQTHRVLYGSVSVPGTTPRIICTNNLEEVVTDTNSLSNKRLKELERRCLIVHINTPVFNKNKFLQTTIGATLHEPIVSLEEYEFSTKKQITQGEQIDAQYRDIVSNKGPIEHLPHVK